MVYMKAKETASRRTKNRLREHGAHGLTEEKRGEPCEALGGARGALLACDCGWVGWLPESEVED